MESVDLVAWLVDGKGREINIVEFVELVKLVVWEWEWVWAHLILVTRDGSVKLTMCGLARCRQGRL